MNIHWYPGHMAKAKRLLKENLKLIDVVIEVLDARTPKGSHNPDLEDIFKQKERIIILNKADLAQENTTDLWIQWYKRQNVRAIPYNSTRSKGAKTIVSLINQAVQEEVDRLRKTKGISKTIRAMVVGIPNVGKSTFINQLSGGSRAKTGDKPGVTRGKQWIKVGPYLELLDTPGLLWPKLDDPKVAKHLAYIGSIKDDILDPLDLCASLLEELREVAAEGLKNRYKLDDLDGSGHEILDRICRKRGWIASGGITDVERGAKTILDEFRGQKIGRITLEKPED